ncbi:formate dehydrogenase subunit gamma [Aureimonas endophytica]|uniref:Formate dehydrogenase subunit gamma n=1 Tax=Aureimonas endophytica TaxID=2027858 RepID=A0A916ZTQ3_9HYPH|nr:formate dehydrogenase subunit gamma [Aureimonas endophytica]GGE13763.1 formate dehydrogenase subunit gamma [Aureimonas endophytica]
MSHAPFAPDEAAGIVAGLKDLEGPLLPILHAIQARFGHVPEAAIRLVAAELNLSRAEVHGTMSFYHDFRAEPAGRRVVKVCRAEACQARGGAAVEAALAASLGLPVGETSPDGRVSLEAVYCLGLCAIGPNALVDGRPVARLDPAKAARLAAEALS